MQDDTKPVSNPDEEVDDEMPAGPARPEGGSGMDPQSSDLGTGPVVSPPGGQG